MWSLNSALNSAMTSLTANQLALAVASNNIANAGDINYTRQRLITAPAAPDGGALGIGAGIDVLGVDAIRDKLLETRLRQENSEKSGAETLSGGLKNIEGLFNDSNGTGLLTQLTDFFNSFQTLSQDTSSMSSREQLKINAQALVNAFNTQYNNLTQIQTDANKAISADVDQINSLTKQIAEVTDAIKVEEVTRPAPELRDKRSALVKQLSGYLDVNELESGSDYQLTTKNNHVLVINNTAQAFSTAEVDSNIGSGSLKSDINLRDTYVPKYLGALDQLAYELTNQVNSIHSTGYDLNGNTNINFFTPLASASGASRLIALNPAVAADARKIVASSSATGNDNNVALQLGNLLHNPVFSGGSVTDQYGSLVFSIGTDVASAQSNVTQHDDLLAQLQNRRQSLSGVSIDEESAQILQFQRAYQASARIITVVDQLIQVTLGMTQ